MRIGLIITGGVDRSGTERVIPAILWLIERLARHHQLTVIALYQYPHACSYSLLGAKVYNLGNPPPLPFGWIPYHLRQIQEIEKAEGGFDVLHAFWGGKTGWLASLYGKVRGIPSVVTLFGGELVGLASVTYGSQLSLKGRLLVNQVLSWATTLTVQSRTMQDLVATRGRQAEHLPIGVDERCFQPIRAKRSLQKRLLQVASLNRVKDQTTLLRAIAIVVQRYPKIHLDIVGEDTLGGTIQALSHQLKLDEFVTFHGFLPQDKIRAFYQNADLFLLTSRHEAGPIAVLEAAACAVPTVGTRVGHVADWDGREAIAVPVGNADALASAIVMVLEDEPRRAMMGRAAQQWAKEYSADSTAQRFEGIFTSLTSAPRTIAATGPRGEVQGVSLDR